ncbi:MAG: methyltransferase domain-containing protein [Thermodesulfobacteriota bacterium]
MAQRVQAAPRIVAREEYRASRLAFLRGVVDLERAEGLEVGALDFPTVLPGAGRCAIADSRSADELARLFGIERATIPDTDYLVAKDRALADQIARRFDYVVLCHVLEHVPDPIRFLNEIAELLRPGGVLVLAIPDKRHTPDASRPSSTVEQLLESHYRRATTPSLAQIMEFARTWLDEWRALAARSPREFYDWAVRQLESGQADVHCNVWRDEELFAQLDYLDAGGFLPRLTPCARAANDGELNEFYVALRARDGSNPAMAG